MILCWSSSLGLAKTKNIKHKPKEDRCCPTENKAKYRQDLYLRGVTRSLGRTVAALMLLCTADIFSSHALKMRKGRQKLIACIPMQSAQLHIEADGN